MIQAIIVSIVGFISFIAIDYIWLSKIAKSFYIEKLGSLVTVKNGSMEVYFPAIPLVYIVIIVGILIFVLRNATSAPTALAYGALFGFILYAVYDFTNLATLKGYSWTLTIVDTLWGTFVVAVVSVIMFLTQGIIS